MEAILQKYNVRGDAQALQRAYRKRKGQQYMASFLDDKGTREVIAMPAGDGGGMEYVLVDACNDKDKIQEASERMRKSIKSQIITREKLSSRAHFLRRKEGMVPGSRTVKKAKDDYSLKRFLPITFSPNRRDYE